MLKLNHFLLATSFVLSTTVAISFGADEEEPTQTKRQKIRVARIDVRGALPETASQPGFLGMKQPHLRKLVARIDKARMDDRISAVYLRVQNPQIDRGRLAELRAAINRLRSAGKKVYAELQMGTAQDYLLATSCDQIIMPESGTLMVTGIRAEITFFKDLLDELDIEADMIQVGDYKGAAEPLTRDSMSDEFRAQYESLIDDLYNHLVETIADERKLDQKKVREAIDIGILTATEARAKGLIDHVAYGREFMEQLVESDETDSLVVVKEYGIDQVDSDLGGITGLMKMMELLMGGQPSPNSGRQKKIAVVYAIGPIMTGESIPGVFGEQIVGSDTIADAIRQAESDRRVIGTVLRVNSPGGSAIASDQIWSAIVAAKKPVIASMGDVAASGGYYISMGCDKIFAEPATLTGSIGVVGGKIAMSGLLKKVGINTEIISRGKNSGLLSPQAKFTNSEREVWLKMMNETYRLFVSKAAEGRKMDRDLVESLAGGRIWTGRQAQNRGLIDQLGSLQDAIDEVKQQTGVDEDEKVELMILPEPTSLLDHLAEGALFSTSIRQSAEALVPGSSTQFQQFAVLQRLFVEPTVLLLPYTINIR